MKTSNEDSFINASMELSNILAGCIITTNESSSIPKSPLPPERPKNPMRKNIYFWNEQQKNLATESTQLENGISKLLKQ